VKKIIEVKNLSIGYDDRTILKNVTFSVNEGEILFIMGGSGTGKTTLLKNLMGLAKPFDGKILINGNDINMVPTDVKRAIQRTIGITFQDGALFGSLSIGENISLLLEEYTNMTKKQIREVVLQKLSQVELEEYVDYYPSEISGGMRKRAGLARAMALNPKILFFDEPSAGLDPITSAGLDRLIYKVGRELNATVVIVSHELDSAYSISDRTIILEKRLMGIAEMDKLDTILKTTKNEWVKRFLERDGLSRKSI